MVHTPSGAQLIRNFLYDVCGFGGLWTPGNFIEESVSRIREQVGDGRVICALSGGVDSAITAALINRAIGDQLTCIFVDNGLLRREEAERVVGTFKRAMSIILIPWTPQTSSSTPWTASLTRSRSARTSARRSSAYLRTWPRR